MDSVHYPASPLNRLREMAVNERPQERLERLGPNALSDVELLALLLRSGTRGQDVITMAAQLLGEANSLAGLVAWKESDFRRLKGIGRVKALQFVAVMELARRVLAQQNEISPLLHRPDLIMSHFQPIVRGLQVEKFWVLCLNRKNRLLKRIEISSGTATAALAHPREVFREAVREAASAVICVHNHPSGDPSPSLADVTVTQRLREAAKALDIAFLDHVIIGHPSADPNNLGYYSFRAGGQI